MRLISPLGTVPTESAPYYWEGVEGATQYQVNIYDQATGLLMGSRYTGSGVTSVVISAGELKVGGAMQWEVIARHGEQVLCSTGLSQPIIHSAPVQPAQPDEVVVAKQGFSISWECSTYNEMTVSWKNANVNDTIDFDITDDYGFVTSVRKRGASGSFTHYTSSFIINRVDGLTSSDEQASISGSLDCFGTSS